MAAAAGIAVINSLGNLGGFLGPYTIGLIRTWTGSFRGGLLAVGALLAVSGGALWVGRRAPCPADPDLARSCQRLRRVSVVIYAAALISFGIGAAFAFVLPAFYS